MTNFQLEFAHQLFVLPVERLEERRGACVRCHRRLEICAGSFKILASRQTVTTESCPQCDAEECRHAQEAA